MSDETRRTFATPADFLEAAKALVQMDCVDWRARHQTGHTVDKATALQVVFWATPANVREDPRFPGRFNVWGKDRANRVIRVTASVVTTPAGDYLSIRTAFDEERPFGS